jgi:hypothetical protein
VTASAGVQAATRLPIATLARVAIFPFAVAVLGLSVAMDARVEVVAPGIFLAVSIGLLVSSGSALAWRSIVAAVALVILVIPIRREAQFSSLPFALEPYRVLVSLVILAWILALLVDVRVRIRHSFLDGPLVVILAVTGGSVIANEDRIAKIDAASGVAKALAFLVAFFLFFWMIVSVIRRFGDIDLVVKALVTGGALITVFSLVEARTGYSIFDQLVRALPGSGRSTPPDPSIVLPSRGGRFRIFGSAQHPIELSAIMAMLVPLGLYLVHTTRRLVWWLAFGLLVLGAVASFSRTGILMLLVVIAVFLWLRPQETLRLWPLAAPGIVLVHFAAPGAMRELLASFFPVGGLVAEQQDAAVGSGRLASLGPALDEVALRPIFGGGYGTRVVLGPEANSFIVDDMWVSLAMEVGIVGVAAWLWLFVRFIRRASPLAKREHSVHGWLLTAVVASVFAYGVGMLTFDTLSFIQVTFLFVIVLALGTSLVSSMESAVSWPRTWVGEPPTPGDDLRRRLAIRYVFPKRT